MIGALRWYYLRQREATETAAADQLAAIADFKTAQIANWRRERVGDGRVLTVSPLMRTAQRVLKNGRATEADRTDIRNVMGRLSHEFLYTDAILVDLNGTVVIRLKEDQAHGPQFGQAFRRGLAQDAVRTGDVVLSDLTRDTRSGRPLMALTIPVRDLGALILEIDPQLFLYPYLQSWPTPSRTAESFLLRFDPSNTILVLSELRYAPGSALTLRSTYAPSEVPDENRFMAGWFHKTADYRGVPALKVTWRVPDSPWYLTAKIDQSEVEAPLTRLSWEITLIVALIAVANAFGVGLIWRNSQLQTVRDREAWFRTFANDTPAYLMMSPNDAQRAFINKPLGKFLGADKDVLNLDGTYMHPEDRERVFAAYREALKDRREYAAEFRLRRFDGEYRWIAGKVVPRLSPKGEFLGYAGSFVDVTERREAESQVRSANSVLAHELKERTRAEREIQALTARLINAQEEERTRLARELHDDVSQQIAALSIGVSNLKRKMAAQPDALAQSERIQQKLVQLAESTRRLSHELHPAVLQYSGLAAALRNYCAEFAALTSHRIVFRAEGSFDLLPVSTALSVYRVAQEALQNSIKHARADEAEVILTSANGAVTLVVSDRGVGMDSGAVAGLGLVSIKERTRLVNGTVEVKSRPGEGVTVTMRVPIPVAEQPRCAEAGAAAPKK